MFRRILYLGLLGCFPQGAYAADCDVNISLVHTSTDTSVEFNPFNPQSTTMNLRVLHNTTNYDSLSISFGAPFQPGNTPSSSLTDYTSYKITSGGTEVFDSTHGTGQTYGPITTISNFAADSSHSIVVTPTPQADPTNDDALSELSGSVTLPVFISSGNPVCSNTSAIEVPMNVSIPTDRAVAFSSTAFSDVSPTAGALDAGTLGDGPSVPQESMLYIWSNANYKITATSDTGYMLRTEDHNGNNVSSSTSSHDVNKLPYTLTIDTSNPISIGGATASGATKTETSDGSDGVTKVEGDQIKVSFTTEDTGKRAGKYSDTVTITISQHP